MNRPSKPQQANAAGLPPASVSAHPPRAPPPPAPPSCLPPPACPHRSQSRHRVREQKEPPMRPTSRLLISLFSLLTLLTAAGFAQKRMCPKPPPSPFKHDGQIVTSYDSRSGGMRTTLQHPRPLGAGAEVYYLAATFMHQDPRRPAAPTLDLILVSASPAASLRQGPQIALPPLRPPAPPPLPP